MKRLYPEHICLPFVLYTLSYTYYVLYCVIIWNLLFTHQRETF
jgi:hypothetical protein